MQRCRVLIQPDLWIWPSASRKRSRHGTWTASIAKRLYPAASAPSEVGALIPLAGGNIPGADRGRIVVSALEQIYDRVVEQPCRSGVLDDLEVSGAGRADLVVPGHISLNMCRQRRGACRLEAVFATVRCHDPVLPLHRTHRPAPSCGGHRLRRRSTSWASWVPEPSDRYRGPRARRGSACCG